MCGIAGIYRLNKNISLEYCPEVLEILKHRGPDFQKHIAYDNAVLYHSRLSIIDLSEYSHQPYTLNQNKCLVYNGEIFNFKELAQYTAISQPKSDTEVIIHYFDKYGINGLSNINGFFAFAFYNHSREELYLVRDRYGEKPLYYYYDNNIFAFASGILPLLKLIRKKLPINKEVLYTYFRLHYIPGNNSIFRGIQRLLPGHYIHIQKNKISIQQWYNLQENKENDLSFSELLDDAVSKRLISDAPIGAFLSGGIDSSVVCALAKKHIKELHTFSLGYKDEKMYNETSDALKVARYIGSIHHSFEITTDDVIAQIPQMLNRIDEPFADSSAINVFILSQKIKPYATVALSGDGADELLMGYNKHKILFLRHYPLLKFPGTIIYPAISMFPESRSNYFFNRFRKLKKFIAASQLSSLKKYIYLSQWTDDAYVNRLLKIRTSNQYFYDLFEKYQNLDEVKLFNLADIEIVLTNDMLYKTDFFGMQNAVEIRSPFLDHRIVEYLYHLNFNQKINGVQQKYLLRKNFSDLLPSSVFTKKKSGFEIPLHKILPHFIRNNPLLEKDYIHHQNIFNYTIIRELTEQLNNNINDSALKLWTILVFQAWYNKFDSYIDKNL